MTVKSNSLSDRLNEFKNKNKNLLENESMGINTGKNPVVDFINSIISLFSLFLKSLIFGYSLRILLVTSWNFWSVLCVGLSITFFLNYIHQLFHDKSLL